MKHPNFVYLTVSLLILGTPEFAGAQHYSDWTGFEYIESDFNDYAYQLQKDYTIDIKDYFTDDIRLPDKHPKGDKAYHDAEFYRTWASNLNTVDTDFIRLEKGGILTVKKGFRWDGASTTCKPSGCIEERYHLRSSLIHDAFYDLLRMRVLKYDWSGALCWEFGKGDRPGDRNRQMADMVLYMISVDDDQPVESAQDDYQTVRRGAVCGQIFDRRLFSWKYHVSGLTAHLTDTGVELKWKWANADGRDPDDWKRKVKKQRNGAYMVMRDGVEIGTVNGTEPPYFKDETVSLTDGKKREYQVASSSSSTDWSNIDIVVPSKGSGTALRLGLDGKDVRQRVASETVSNDLAYPGDPSVLNLFPGAFSLEAWVSPQNTSGNAHVISFEIFAENGQSIHLAYCADEQRFCVVDDLADSGPAAIAYSDSTFEPSHWYHIALTSRLTLSLLPIPRFEQQNILYVDGESQAVFPRSGTEIIIPPRRGSRLSIGGGRRAIGGSQRYLMGMVDEIRIWNVARTNEQIAANMCSPLHSQESSLIGLWHLDSSPSITNTICSEDDPGFVCTAYDATSHANDGFISDNRRPFVPSVAMIPGDLAQDIEVALDANGEASVSADQVAFADNACIVNQEISRYQFTCADIGSNPITLSVLDKNGTVWDEDANVMVSDDMPPTITKLEVSPKVIRSPSNGMVPVTVGWPAVADNCSSLSLGTCWISSVTASEPITDKGAIPDYEKTGTLTVNLRASSSPGHQRMYTLGVVCGDDYKNVSEPFKVFIVVGAGNNKTGAGAISPLGLMLLLLAPYWRRNHRPSDNVLKS